MALIVGGTAVDATATEINNALDGMAQGDIVYASAADTPAQLTKGTDDYILTMNGNVPNWEAASGGGGVVLQVSSAAATIAANTNSSQYSIKATPAPSITTTVENSDILIIAHARCRAHEDETLVLDLQRIVTDGATTDTISGGTEGFGIAGAGASDGTFDGTIAINYLDSLSLGVASTITYKFQYKAKNNSQTVIIGDGNIKDVITLMEISP